MGLCSMCISPPPLRHYATCLYCSMAYRQQQLEEKNMINCSAGFGYTVILGSNGKSSMRNYAAA